MTVHPLLHPEFKLNGEKFPSAEALRVTARTFITRKQKEEEAIGHFILEWLSDKEYIKVKTSGSTGTPKNINLQKFHVQNSASATVSYFDIKEGTRALLCLPSEYIAGKMMLVRAMIAGWDLFISSPEKNPLSRWDLEFDFTAMVPYQVHHSLPDLHKVKKMIVGGGALSRSLEDILQNQKTEIFATYGMTETISHIAVRAVNGSKKSKIFNAIPNVKFSQTENGCLVIDAPSIANETIVTNDVVALLSENSFELLGRIDNVINSGGIKIHPEIIEEKLARDIQQPFFIASEKDEILGERVVLIIESSLPIEEDSIFRKFENLSQYEKPKKIICTSEFIYTETGKIRRSMVLQQLKIESRK